MNIKPRNLFYLIHYCILQDKTLLGYYDNLYADITRKLRDQNENMMWSFYTPFNWKYQLQLCHYISMRDFVKKHNNEQH